MKSTYAQFKREVVTTALKELWACGCDRIHVTAVYNENCKVPLEYVKDETITLNVSDNAVSGLRLGEEELSFNARFNGKSYHCVIPYTQIVSVLGPSSLCALSLAYVDVRTVVKRPPEKTKPVLSIVKKD